MIKTFLILTILQHFLYSQQIILVVSENFKVTKATLYCYEDNKKVLQNIEVNLGRNGLGWGLGKVKIEVQKDEPIKKEGDGKAPAGIFELLSTFGYKKRQNFNLDYQYLSKQLICVDDSSSQYYNKIIKLPKDTPKSFEIMRRDDKQYELGVVVAHNTEQKNQAGSCIFLHVHKHKNAPTAGCTSMSLDNMKKINMWLDRDKNPILIQVPRSYLGKIKELFPNLPVEPFVQPK